MANLHFSRDISTGLSTLLGKAFVAFFIGSVGYFAYTLATTLASY